MNEVNNEYLNLTAGVWLPGVQSVVNGVWFGVALTGFAGISNHLGFTDLPLWAVGLSAFSVAGLAKWRELLHDWQGLLYGIEENEPGYEPSLQPVRVEIASNNGRSMQFVDLPAQPEQLAALGFGLVEGASFTEARWTGSRGIFSRSDFVLLREAMIRRGLAAWNSPNDTARGVRVTGKGMAIMRYFANTIESPTLFERVSR